MEFGNIDDISRDSCHITVVEQIISGHITAQSLLSGDAVCTKLTEGGAPDFAGKSLTASQACEEFLSHIYEQIDELLSQCSTQTRSLTNTPVSVPPQQQERHHERPDRSLSASAKPLSSSTTHTAQGCRSADLYSDRKDRGRHGDSSDGKTKPMRRIKLFSANQSDSDKSGDSRNTNDFTNSDVRPLSSSTPSHNRSNHSLTLADFMTPERRKQRRTPHKPQQALANPFISPPCGSWSTNIGKTDITPLRAICNITTPDRSNASQNRSHDSSTSDSSPYRNDLDTSHDETDGSLAGTSSIKKLETLTEDRNEDCNPIIQPIKFTVNGSVSSSPQTTSVSKSAELGNKKSRRVTLTAAQSNQQPSRRITPTPVTSNRSWSNGFRQQAVFTPQSPQKSQSTAPKPGNFSEERSKLREKKDQIMSMINNTEAVTNSPRNAVTPSKISTAMMRSKAAGEEQFVEPDPGKVTCAGEIVRAAETFALLITAGKTQNIPADLHLLVQLLCCRVPLDQAVDSGPQPATSPLLRSVHNMLFFAAKTLSKCQVLIDMMDASVRRLLSQNDRLVRYDAELCTKLKEQRSEVISHASQSSFSSVSFQAETDNCSNFPSERNFITFKKQRDMFYELKRIWENNHSVPGWSFHTNCSLKVSQLFDTNSHDVSNYVHFSRLFVNQLLISCLKDLDESWVDTDDASLTLLQNLKVTQPEKYRKLRERFVIPLTAPAQQERRATFERAELFFKTFIDAVQESRFTQHLKEMLTMKLLSLNNTVWDVEPSDDNADIEISSSVEQFSDSVLSTRLLAKFLGYISFSPYKCNDSKTLSSDEQYRLLRLSCPPPLDIKEMLRLSVKDDHMYVMLPWVVQYLSQIDAYGMTLPYYADVFRSLTLHYNMVKRRIAQSCVTEHLMLEYVSLSWLFNLEQFQTLPTSDTQFSTKKNGMVTTNIMESSNKLVGHRLVYDCCMILQCVKCTLVQFVMGMNNKVVTSRKITPLTSTHSEIATQKETGTVAHPSQTSMSTLQQNLEENFFHNQPASMKKSCDFIAERVSSSYIKDFRANSMINMINESKSSLVSEIWKVDGNSEIKEKMAPVIHTSSIKTHTALHKLALDGVDKYFESRVSEILKLLLPPESEEHIITICSGVIIRQGFERVAKWLNSNLTYQYISAELNQEMTKYLRTGSASGQSKSQMMAVQTQEYGETTPVPSDALLDMQLLLCNITSARSDAAFDVEGVVSRVVRCIQSYPDLLGIAVKSLCQLIVILMLQLAEHRPEDITPNVLRYVETLFKTDALNSTWSELSSLFPKADGDVPGSLFELLLSHILVKKKLLKVC